MKKRFLLEQETTHTKHCSIIMNVLRLAKKNSDKIYRDNWKKKEISLNICLFIIIHLEKI
jgi:hypothetical protein